MNTITQSELDSHLVRYTKADFGGKIIVYDDVNLMQYDNKLVWLSVDLYKNGKPYSLPDFSDLTCSIRWLKKDGTTVYNTILGTNEDKSTVYVEVTNQMTSSYGLVKAVLEIKYTEEGSEMIAGSTYIPVKIDRNPVQEDDEIYAQYHSSSITIGNTTITEDQLKELLNMIGE